MCYKFTPNKCTRLKVIIHLNHLSLYKHCFELDLLASNLVNYFILFHSVPVSNNISLGNYNKFYIRERRAVKFYKCKKKNLKRVTDCYLFVIKQVLDF